MRVAIYLIVSACASAAATVAPASAPPAAAPAQEIVAEPNRPLTPGEIALLRPIFRDGIDYEHVRVIDNSFPLQPENVYMTPRGHIYAPGALWQADFSIASPDEREVFVHEITHVWQYANGMDLISQSMVDFARFGGQYEKAYAYELAPGRDLLDYGMEQQAAIIQDYFAITVDHDPPRDLVNASNDAAERDRLYRSVIASFLGNARYARAIDAKSVAARHAESAQKPPPDGTPAGGGASRMCEWRFTPPVPPQRRDISAP